MRGIQRSESCVCVGDVQAVVLRSESQLHLFRRDSDRYLA